jgi:hypothetical protein
MPDVLIRDLDRRSLDTLKKSALARGRSLQAELKDIVETAARRRNDDIWRRIDRLREMTRGRIQDDSSDIIRESRGPLDPDDDQVR